MRDLYDEMLDDIEIQEKKKPTQFDINEVATDFDPREKDLTELESYGMTEEQEDDFDLTYRTPNFVFEEGPKKAETFIGTVLPNEVTITDDIYKYSDKEHAKYPGIDKMMPKRFAYDDKKDIYDENTDESKKGTGAIYDPILDEIIIDKSYLNKNTFRQNLNVLIHENIHKNQREIEFRKPMPRVMSEPNKAMFQQMHDDNTIINDFSGFLKGNPIGQGPHRKNIIKNRREESDDYKNMYPFSEQLAYFGETNFNKSIRNPKRKTERVLNRMWFQ